MAYHPWVYHSTEWLVATLIKAYAAHGSHPMAIQGSARALSRFHENIWQFAGAFLESACPQKLLEFCIIVFGSIHQLRKFQLNTLKFSNCPLDFHDLSRLGHVFSEACTFGQPTRVVWQWPWSRGAGDRWVCVLTIAHLLNLLKFINTFYVGTWEFRNKTLERKVYTSV